MIEQANTILFQNWDHLLFIMQRLNQIPDHKQVTNDIYTIRPYYFDNLSKFYRQTIIHSEFVFNELNILRLN